MRIRFVIPALFAAAAAHSQSDLPREHAPRPTTAAITPADLITRLYIFADDSMQGRQGGSEGNLKATAYIAAEAKKLGLLPAGDSGTYFQYIPLVKRSYAATATLRADTIPLVSPAAWIPFSPRGGRHPLEGARVIYGGIFTDSATWITATQAAGRLVVFSVPGPRLVLPVIRGNSRFSGAAGIAVTGLDSAPPALVADIARAHSFALASGGPVATSPQPMIISRSTAAIMLRRPLDSAVAGDTGVVIHGALAVEDTPAPARNVVAILPGRDAKLRGEYVALGAHSDHIGLRDTPADFDSLRAYNTALWEMRHRDPNLPRPSRDEVATIHVNVDSLHHLRPARLDSINNGADDDGSGSVGLLEMAQAAAALKPHPKRSLLFVWHTGEELGLLGSRWFTDNPTVPRDSIVAQLNIDMIGRGGANDIKGGGPRYLELVGSFRLSTELGNTAERVNKARKQPFVFDYTFDAAGQAENIYCRSDHANYARFGIPVIFFTTGLHQDYHQVTDEAQFIDYDHFAHVAQYVFDVAIAVANQPARPVVDKPIPDPKLPCRQ